MATPEAYTLAIVDFAGLNIRDYIREHVPTSQTILDVGAGWGKYRFLLPEYEMDAVDIWAPYVEKHHLDAYYRNVYIEDIADWEPQEAYGAVTMGDVLEHIPTKRAQKVVKMLCSKYEYVCIAVPFEMEQHEVEGNKHEAHQQADLNEKIMAERYPELKLWKKFGRPGEHVKGIYIKR